MRIAPTNRVWDTRIGVAHYGEKVSIGRVSRKLRAQSEVTAPFLAALIAA